MFLDGPYLDVFYVHLILFENIMIIFAKYKNISIIGELRPLNILKASINIRLTNSFDAQ